MAKTKFTSLSHYSQKPGLNSVGQYQMSGIPFLTGTTDGIGGQVTHKIEFPTVTKTITIINTDTQTDADLRVHFAPSSSAPGVFKGHHYVTLQESNTSMTFNVKVREIFISNNATAGGSRGSYDLVAELTGIPIDDAMFLTGSGISKVPGETGY